MNGFKKFLGHSESMLEIFETVRRAAETDCTILLTGESGTGKDLMADAVHQLSPRRKLPFVAVNIAAIPEALVESELFGHVQGAFTGATAARRGRIQAADSGTLFIDEIGDFKLEAQAKMLRALETRTVSPVGSNSEIKVDVRIVAATSRNLEEMVADGSFRDDLYYRLNVVQIRLPPLRERREDIPVLVHHFLEQSCRKYRQAPLSFDSAVMNYFERFEWPGNVRQLRNTIESMVILDTDGKLTIYDLPDTLWSRPANRKASPDFHLPTGMTLDELEQEAIRQKLKQHEGDVKLTAEELGISVRTLQRRFKRNGELAPV